MATVCPTVLAAEPHEFREQMERIAHFGNRVQIDLTDGLFALTKTVPLEQVWWPHGLKADLHLMYKRPDLFLNQVLDLEPSLVIIHAEAEGDFESFAAALHEAGIKVGVALLQKTEPEVIKAALGMIEHVLIFSGDLGKFGGDAHLHLLGKILKLKQWKPDLEIGWDGGINDKNAKQLAKGGVDVLNVGGFIQKAKDPASAYAKLVTLVETVHGTKTDPRTA
jgi:ribulose-phosphate 3-epimerase